jgi:predicted nuclease of predicted toxin-antitoxin system
MRVKLDENLGMRGAEIFRKHGHDVATVSGQQLQSSPDRELIRICANEDRCLVTLDLDFSQPLQFPPHKYAGIAVLRLPHQADPSDLFHLIEILAQALVRGSIRGRLWIVQRSGIREYDPDT